MTVYIANGFSKNMIKKPHFIVECTEISAKEFKKEIKGGISYIGHEDTAKYLNVPFNRGMLQLEKGDILYTVTPPRRMREGETTLTDEDFKGLQFCKWELIK